MGTFDKRQKKEYNINSCYQKYGKEEIIYIYL